MAVLELKLCREALSQTSRSGGKDKDVQAYRTTIRKEAAIT